MDRRLITKEDLREALLIDSKALAEILRIKYSTVRSWVSQGKVPGAVKINGCRRFVLSEILKWINESRGVNNV